MSDLSAGFLFGSNFFHSITCILPNENSLITGSTTGEIVIWFLKDTYEAGIVCCSPESHTCLSLCFITPPPEVKGFFYIDRLLVSLHSNSKLRTWDVTDGKCLSYSGNLFSELNCLSLMSKSSHEQVFVAGINEIFLIDCLKMTSIRYFCTNGMIAEILPIYSKLIAQTADNLWIFDLNESAENNAHISLNVKIDPLYQTFIEAEGQVVIVANNQNIYAVDLESEEIFIHSMYDKIEYICYDSGYILIVYCTSISFYSKCELLSNCEYLSCIEKIGLDVIPKLCKLFNGTITICDGKKINQFNIALKNLLDCQLNFSNPEFTTLNNGEIITARNIIFSEEVMLAIGTNQGRVILKSINSSTKLIYCRNKIQVTAIYLNQSKLAVAYINETLSFWDFKLVDGTSYHLNPLKTIEVWASPIQVMLPISYSKINMHSYTEISWKNSKSVWKNILLAQCDSGAVLLLDFQASEISNYFQALKSFVKDAIMFLNLEYLAVHCVNGSVYIFNMAMLALEREFPADSGNFSIFNNSSKSYLKLIDRSDRVAVCFEFFFKEPCRKAIEVKFLNIGMAYFPILCVNFSHLSNTKKKNRFNLQSILKNEYLNQSIFSQGNAVSSIHSWIESKHMNSILIASMLLLNIPPPKLIYNSISLIILALNPQTKMLQNLLNFIDFSSEIIAIAELLLRPSSHHKKRHRMLPALAKPSKTNTEDFKQPITFLQIISIAIIACTSISSSSIKNPKLLDFLLILLKSGDKGCVHLACELLSKGKNLLNDQYTDNHVKEFTKELLVYSCKDDFCSISKRLIKLMSLIGVSSPNKFILVLVSELNSEVQSNYAINICNTIEHFVLHHFVESTSALEELGEFIMKGNEIQSTVADKSFIVVYQDLLKVCMGLLPMVCLSNDQRNLIIGLPTGYLNLYDFKANKRWKALKIFDTTISALDCYENFIACYSSQDCTLKIIKIEKRLLGTFLGNGSMKITEVIQLPDVDPVASSYQELVKTIKLRWINNKIVMILRENKLESTYLVNKLIG